LGFEDNKEFPKGIHVKASLPKLNLAMEDDQFFAREFLIDTEGNGNHYPLIIRTVD
jgi:hypothetical protein